MRLLSFVSLLLTMLSASALAEIGNEVGAEPRTENSRAGNTHAGKPVLVELFTSQSCSSCPRAEAVFSELAQRDDLVVIQWHVDYWDNLVHGRDGKWKDPYSSAANTQRQRDYNYALRGTGSVYTPQAVIGGLMETTGSRAQVIETMISQAPAAYAQINVRVDTHDMVVSIAPNAAYKDMEAEVMLVELVADETNKILGGENRGETAHSRNVAVSSDTLGSWDGAAETYRARRMDDTHECAVFVQEKGTGRILGASYCPLINPRTDRLVSPSDFIDAHP